MSDESEDRDPGQRAAAGNAAKDPADWVTGDEPMTEAQASYLGTLCAETGEEMDPSLTKAEASRRIDALKKRDPRLAAGSDEKRRG
jgi:hypothetical protein